MNKKGDFLQVDQSALTGESLPVNKQVNEGLYANAIIKQGEMIAKVTATGLNTYFGKTVGLVAKAEKEEHGHFQTMVIKVGDYLIFMTIFLIAIIIWHGIHNHEPILDLLIFALILTISAIPVAMPAVLTVTMALGARVLATKQAIVTKLSAIEEAAGMDILCSDKTGTLTQNKMSLAKPYVAKAFTSDALMLYGAYASKKENEDPIEKPIFDYISQHQLEEKFSQIKMMQFIPFDPIHKKTEALFNNGITYVKGAPQVIIELCNENIDEKKLDYAQVESFAQKGFRTLGVAYKQKDEKEYHFYDTKLGVQKSYYRLKVVEADGTSSYSQTILVNKEKPNQFAVVAYSSVMAKTTFDLTLDAVTEGQLEYALVSYTGELIFEEFQFLYAGLNEIQLSLQDLPEGTYKVKLKLDA